MADYNFAATTRTKKGKSWARSLRNEGKLPAVVYGRGEKSFTVEVSAQDIPMLYLRTLGRNTLLTMNLTDEKGAKTDTIVMFKDVQREPVKNKFQHVDFYHVDPKHPLKLKVPVVLEGVPVGVKESGGILSHPTRNLVLRCLPADIPKEIKIDISAMGLDESLLLQDVKPPKGVTFLSDAHSVLALVTAVEEEKAPDPTAAPAAGPEVIKEKKPADGAAAPAAGAKGAPAAGGKAAPAAKAAPKK